MKYRLLVLLLAALLLAGCQDRSGPAPSSSSEVESAGSASEGPRTPLETALDENIASAFPTGSDWEALSALGITAQAGRGEFVNQREYRCPVTIQNAEGEKATLVASGVYKPGDIPDDPGENLRISICGFLPVGEDKLLLADAFQVKLISTSHLEKEPQMLYSIPPEEGSVVDAAYDPQGGYLVLTVDGEDNSNTLIHLDLSGKETGRTHIPKPESSQSALFGPYERMTRTNDCQYLPLGQMRYVPMEEPVWLLEDRALWNPSTKELQENFGTFFRWEGEECHLRLCRREVGGEALALLERPGEKTLGFFFDSSAIDPSLGAYEGGKEWITGYSAELSVPRLRLEAGELRMAMAFDFEAQTAQVEYSYTPADLQGIGPVCSSPSGARAVYLPSTGGMGDAMWGNYALYDSAKGTVEYLAPSLGASSAFFAGEERVFVNNLESLSLYDAATAQPIEKNIPIPSDQSGKARWAIACIGDAKHQLALALCREAGYDFPEETVPVSLVVYDLSGQVVRDIPTDIRTHYIYKNYPYNPDIQLDGQGNLLVRNGEGALLGTIPYLQ